MFEKCLGVILHHEGGYVHNPLDPGGVTNLGITKAVYESWVKRKVTDSEMRALTKEIVAPIYRKNYWNVLQCDELLKIAPGLALCVFDFGVNAGTNRAAKYLQQLVKVNNVDGSIGPATLAATKRFVENNGHDKTVSLFQQARREYYKSLKRFFIFGRGWLRRVDSVEVTAKVMD